jgi:glycosyltransferase involved in cell wall biosynthesis
MNIAIIVIAYNRPDSIGRLLKSLDSANYSDEQPTLILSIDNCGDRSVLDVAEAFDWKHGDKQVRFHEERLGLRRHVLSCGDLSSDYDAVIVLEDDLYVSEDFYRYTRAAIGNYNGVAECAGVSLYNHQINVHNMLPFDPISDGSDVYYLQMASSWGVAWDSAQWQCFRQWLNVNQDYDFEQSPLPRKIKNWKDTSWLKLFAAFLYEEDRYFVYPRISLTTNFSDPGTHVDTGDTRFQVPLASSRIGEYTFSSIESSVAKYDAYFESRSLWKTLGLKDEDLVCDLYGYGRLAETGQLMLSPLKSTAKCVQGFGLALKPHDQNVFSAIEGSEISLYEISDTRVSLSGGADSYQTVLYYQPWGSLRKLVTLVVGRVQEGLKRKFKG